MWIVAKIQPQSYSSRCPLIILAYWLYKSNRTHTHTHTHTHIHTYTNTHTHKNTHTYIRMYMYKQGNSQVPRDFRPLRYSSRDSHAEGEHVNWGRDTPSFCPTLQVLEMSTLLCLSWLFGSPKGLMNYPVYIYTGCNRRKGPNFGRVFLMWNYTEKTQNTYVQSWTVWEIMASEVWNFDSCYTLTDYQIHIETGRNMWFL